MPEVDVDEQKGHEFVIGSVRLPINTGNTSPYIPHKQIYIPPSQR